MTIALAIPVCARGKSATAASSFLFTIVCSLDCQMAHLTIHQHWTPIDITTGTKRKQVLSLDYESVTTTWTQHADVAAQIRSSQRVFLWYVLYRNVAWSFAFFFHFFIESSVLVISHEVCLFDRKAKIIEFWKEKRWLLLRESGTHDYLTQSFVRIQCIRSRHVVWRQPVFRLLLGGGLGSFVRLRRIILWLSDCNGSWHEFPRKLGILWVVKCTRWIEKRWIKC